MPDNPLAKKLLIKPGVGLLLLNAPTAYRNLLGELPEGVRVSDTPGATFDVVHLFVNDRAELERYAALAMESTKPKGVLWISYPKKSSRVKTDITRDIGWDAVRRAGWRGVTQVSIDETWSALRFRPAAEVGT